MTAEPQLDAIRCIVFDFDGTLVESNPIKREAYYEIFARTTGSADVLERVIRANPEADRYGIVGETREEMIFDKEKLLMVFDRTKDDKPRKNPAITGY